MEYIRLFEQVSDYENFINGGGGLEATTLSFVEETGGIYSVEYTPVDDSKEYLTFVALEDGTFSFTKKGTGDDIQYSLDNGGTWVSLASGEYTPTITAGNKIMWKSTITPITKSGIGQFSSTSKFNVEGNIMSMLFGDDFKNKTDLTGKDYAFYQLFNKSKVVNAYNLKLSATTLTISCYSQMFSGCTSLTTAPELPATTLTITCYAKMFYGCKSLTTAPELPATTLFESCYYDMFSGCTRMTTAPELPATTLAANCYFGMFNGCLSLTTAPELPATTLVKYCYKQMFYGCRSLSVITMLATDISAEGCLSFWVNGVSSTGTFVKHPDMTSLSTGLSGIPSGWEVVDKIDSN